MAARKLGRHWLWSGNHYGGRDQRLAKIPKRARFRHSATQLKTAKAHLVQPVLHHCLRRAEQKPSKALQHKHPEIQYRPSVAREPCEPLKDRPKSYATTSVFLLADLLFGHSSRSKKPSCFDIPPSNAMPAILAGNSLAQNAKKFRRRPNSTGRPWISASELRSHPKSRRITICKTQTGMLSHNIL